MDNLRIGTGFDVHRFGEGRDLVLGGEKIDHPMGLVGHSDADVLVHAIIDAILGATSLGDIGKLFPDTDEKYRNISSIKLLGEVYGILRRKNISIINIDSTVICEFPKIAPHIPAMKKNLSDAMGNLASHRISIKGTTTEKLGFTGREEGIAVQSVVLLRLD